MSRGRRRPAPLRQRLRQRRGRAVHRRPRRRSATATRSSCCRPSPAARPDRWPRTTTCSSSVGSTPLVGLPRLSPTPDVRLWAKLEDRNPTGLDQGPRGAGDGRGGREGRPAAARLHDPRAHQSATPASRWRWPPSCKGYRLVCVMPENTSEERRQLLRMWGAEIISSPAAGGSNEAVRVAKEIAGRAPRLGDALPVRQPGQRPRPLRGHRPRDPRRPADGHPLRRPGSAPPAR